MDEVSAITQKCISNCQCSSLPFVSQCSSKAISDACSEKRSKKCWTDPCCNLSEVQIAKPHSAVWYSVQWGPVFSGDNAARSACENILNHTPWTHHSLSSRAWSTWTTVTCSSRTTYTSKMGQDWAVLHISWWNAIWWHTELNTVVVNLTTTWDCFLFLTSRF